MAIGRMTGFGNDQTLEFEVFASISGRFAPAAVDALSLVRPARMTDRLESLRVMGSNNWAVDGRHTESGRPLLAGDPHQGFTLPGCFYALHLNSRDAGRGGTLDVAGFSFPGVPGVSLGHTDRVAWTVTTAFADVMDVFAVRRTADGEVEVAGVPTAVERRVEEVAVRDEAAVTFEFEDVEGLGVLLPDSVVPLPAADLDRALLLRWTGFAPRPPRGLLGLNRAGSIEEFEAAVDSLTGSNYNFVAADEHGITHRVGLEVPERQVTPERAPWLVLDGDDPGGAWTGRKLSAEQLPRSRGGERGWIATANEDPFGFTQDGDLQGDPWYFGAFFAPGWRAGRIEDELGRLTARGDVTVDDMRALQLDLHSNLADDLLPALQESLVEHPLAELLLSWDRRMAADSHAAAVFHAFAHHLTARVLEDDFGLLFGQALNLKAVYVLKLAAQAITGSHPEAAALIQQGRDEALREALEDTADWLATLPSPAPTLAEVHTARFDGSLGAGILVEEAPAGGGETTVNVSPSTFRTPGGKTADTWVSEYGPLMRLLFEFGDDGRPELSFNAPLTNVAGAPARWHDGWRTGSYERLPTRRADVEARTEGVLELQVE